MSLLSLATERRTISGSPLAFGEDGVKNRIKNVLTYKKPSRVVVVLSIAFVAVLSLGLVGSRAISSDSYGTQATGAGISESGDVHEYTPYYTDSGNGNSASSTDSSSSGDGSINYGSTANSSGNIGKNSGSTADSYGSTADSYGPVATNHGSGGSENTDPGGNTKADNIYTISNYYNEGGRFSDPGLALTGEYSEKVLMVSRGDILIAGDHQYEVLAQSLTLSLYTQPSPDQVIHWWTDYLNSWADSGKVMLLG